MSQRSLRIKTGGGGATRELTVAAALGILIFLDLTYALNAADRQVFPVLLPAIRNEFGFSLPEGGLLATIFTLGVGIAGLFTGALLSRYSRKYVMAAGIAVFTLFTLLQPLSVGFFDMATYRIFSGVGEGLQNAALFTAVGAYFVRNRSLAIGSVNVAYGVGGFLGPFLGGRLLGIGGWHLPFYVYGAVGVLFTILVIVLVPDKFEEGLISREITLDTVERKDVAWNVTVGTIIAVVAGFTLYSYFGLYPTFLKTVLHFTPIQAGDAASLYGIGGILALVGGWLADRIHQRTVGIIGFGMAIVVAYLMFNVVDSVAGQQVLSFFEGVGVSGFVYTNTVSLLQRSAGDKLLGLVNSLFVAGFFIPAAIAGLTFGSLAESLGWNGAALVQLEILPAIGIVLMFFFRYSKIRQSAFRTDRIPVIDAGEVLPEDTL